MNYEFSLLTSHCVWSSSFFGIFMLLFSSLGYFIRWSCKLVSISSTYNCKSPMEASHSLGLWGLHFFFFFGISYTRGRVGCESKSNQIQQKLDIARVSSTRESTVGMGMGIRHFSRAEETLKVMLLINTFESHSQISSSKFQQLWGEREK